MTSPRRLRRPSTGRSGRCWPEEFGDVDLDAVRPSNVLKACKAAQQGALRRAHNQGGVYAFEHTVSAARKLFDLALRDGRTTTNPALAVDKPRRPPSRRHALSDGQVAEMFLVATNRDTMVLRFMLETGCRREGLCNLSDDKIHRRRQTVILGEKGSRQREQPVSAAMMEVLTDSARPLFGWTRRRLDTLWCHQRQALPWADELGVSGASPVWWTQVMTARFVRSLTNGLDAPQLHR